jgi:hypothetical protein
MKRTTRIFWPAAVLCLVGLSLYAQKSADLVGTWSGAATLAGVDAPNELTLVLELKEGKLVGTMSDQFQTIDRFSITDVTFEKGLLSFSSPVAGPGGQQATIKFKMTVSGDSMKGEMEVPEMGMTGAWEATKKK